MADWEERHERRDGELYFCECSNPDCDDKIRLSKDEYEWVRSDPCRFVILPGHQVPDIENVVRKLDDHYVIEKTADAGEVVKALDPRS